MKISMKSVKGSVTVDGREFSGESVTIINGKVIVDGVEQSGELVGDVNVTINGDVEKLELSSGRVRAGHVGSVVTQSGDVECGDVAGSVSTMSGDVVASKVSGSVSTMSGDIIHGR